VSKNPDYTIRRVTPDDISDFIALRGRMFVEVGFGDLDDLNTVSAGYFTRAIPSEEFIGIIAISPEGETVGSAGMSHYTMPPKPTQPGWTIRLYIEYVCSRRTSATRACQENDGCLDRSRP
jgi:hypothetical protein